MLLQSLVKLYETLAQKGEIEKLGWSPVKISYGLCLDNDGNIDKIIFLKQKTSDGKKEIPRQISLPMPVKRSSGVASNFLYENSTYLFGYDSSGKPDRATKAYQACKEKHCKILENCDSDAAVSIKKFFDHTIENVQDELLSCGCTQPMVDEILGKGANMLLMPLGKYPFDFDEICRAWDESYANSDGEKGICLVTGKYDKIAVLHPLIKNVKGSQSAGASLISFNGSAFESYGKTQGYNATVSEYAAFAYAAALNKLISDTDHRINVGDTTVVCWTEDAEPAYQSMLCSAFDGNDDTVSQADLKSAITHIAHGETVNWEKVPLHPDNNFYILGISPNLARLSVRFFIKNTFGKVMQNVLLHEEQMKIVRPSFETREHLTLWQTVSQTVNPKSKDKSCKPHLAGDVLNAILNGTSYPATLYYGVQSRISAEREITWGKAAIIKAYLMRNIKTIPKEDLTVELNEHSENKAYLLGILFSNLEEIQNAANPGIKATIKDRYFTSASSTPALIFPLLIELAQAHLKKIGETSRKIYYQKKLTETMSKLGTKFPVRLKLEEKGMFQLGYYHQTQKRYTRKEEVNNG